MKHLDDPEGHHLSLVFSKWPETSAMPPFLPTGVKHHLFAPRCNAWLLVDAQQTGAPWSPFPPFAVHLGDSFSSGNSSGSQAQETSSEHR